MISTKRKNKKPSKKNVSEINPDRLVKKALNKKSAPYKSEREFTSFNLQERLLKNVLAKGFSSPTEIQDKSFDQLVLGKDMIGIAATGTGKTAAYLIPIIQQILSQKNKISALVVVPTRELAQQVDSEFRSLVKGLSLRSACFIGGTKVEKDVVLARKDLDMIIGTPGRVNDLIKRKVLKIDKKQILVLDEFDRMLDMGFIHDVNRIITCMKERRQTLLFSATQNQTQKKVIQKIVPNAIKVSVSDGTKSSDNVDQSIIKIKSNENKFDVLLKMLKKPSFEKVILFAETKRVVNKLSKQLSGSGIKTGVIHGNKSQNYRSNTINLFKKGSIQILVATDVASRGIDVDGVTHVINYQLPQTMDSYIHRIGRTGRGQSTGMAYTFVN